MPDGVVRWFDGSTGEALVVRKGRELPVAATELEPAARHAGARVHFDISRDGGVDRAVRVTLRRGTRVSPHQRGFGSLVGAHQPDDKGASSFVTTHPELGLSRTSHPLEVARSWSRTLAEGDLHSALSLYAPDATVYAGNVSYFGRRQVQAYWEASPLLGIGRSPRITGDGNVGVVVWDRPGLPARVEVRCRVEHGRLVEQRVGTPAEARRTVAVAAPAGPVPVAVSTHGDVAGADVTYGQQRLAHVLAQVGDPILFARLKLSRVGDPARERPAIAEVALDVNGDLVRAHVAAHDLREAADLLERRLRAQLVHRADRRVARRHGSGRAEPGEWRHGDLPARRPEHVDRPVDERRLVRHKTFFVDDMTPDEAAFDMEQLDYDFHLFRDLASGRDALLVRDGDGYRLDRLGPADGEPAAPARPPEGGAGQGSGAGGTARVAAASTSAVTSIDGREVVERAEPAPVLSVAEAVERMDSGGERLVFFANATTGRGTVVYRRYDGHYGLISPD